jgi:hypothetical protein
LNIDIALLKRRGVAAFFKPAAACAWLAARYSEFIPTGNNVYSASASTVEGVSGLQKAE